MASVLAALALAASALAGPATSPDFTRADLRGLVFGRHDAPPGTNYEPFSGPNLLERQGNLGPQLRQLRRRGFLADHGSQFSAKSRRSGIAFFEALALLFRSERDAARGLDYLLGFQRQSLAPTRLIPALGLGEAAWGLRGKFEGEFRTFVYAWRIGDLIQVATLAPLHGRRLSPNAQAATLRLARRLEALATPPTTSPPPVPTY